MFRNVQCVTKSGRRRRAFAVHDIFSIQRPSLGRRQHALYCSRHVHEVVRVHVSAVQLMEGVELRARGGVTPRTRKRAPRCDSSLALPSTSSLSRMPSSHRSSGRATTAACSCLLNASTTGRVTSSTGTTGCTRICSPRTHQSEIVVHPQRAPQQTVTACSGANRGAP